MNARLARPLRAGQDVTRSSMFDQHLLLLAASSSLSSLFLSPLSSLSQATRSGQRRRRCSFLDRVRLSTPEKQRACSDSIRLTKYLIRSLLRRLTYCHLGRIQYCHYNPLTLIPASLVQHKRYKHGKQLSSWGLCGRWHHRRNKRANISTGPSGF